MNILGKLLPLVIVLAGVIAYAGSFSGAFVFDDYIWIVDNENIKHFLPSMLYSSRPVVGLTFYLNCIGSGGLLKVADFHLINLIIHLISALLLYGICRRTLLLPRLAGKFSSHEAVLAAAVSVIWAVHPLQTESVTYIVQRSESLMGMFYLLSLYCVIRASGSTVCHQWNTTAIVSCALGMATKPVMVTAPLIILLYDRTFVTGSFARSLKERWGLYAGLALTWIIPAALLSFPNESSTSAGFGASADPPLSYLMTQQGVILHYIKLALWPDGLCIDYDWPSVVTVSGKVIFQAVLVFLLVAGSLLLSTRRNILGFVGLWFIMNLAPTSSFVPLSDSAAEHRMYLPLISIVVFFAFGLYGLLRLPPGIDKKSSWTVLRMPVFGVLIAVVSILFVFLTVRRNKVYQSDESMWMNVLSVNPGNLRGQLGVGTALLKRGITGGAERYFLRILENDRLPHDRKWKKRTTEFVMAYNNLGSIRFQEGKYVEAETLFRKSISISPCDAAKRNLVLSLEMQKGR